MWDIISLIVGAVVGAIGIFVALSIYAWYRVKKLRNEFGRLGIKAPKGFKFPNEMDLKVPQMGKVKQKDRTKEIKGLGKAKEFKKKKK